MESIDRVKAVFRGERPDRVPVVDYYWTSTITAWRKQGMPDESPEYVFDHDIVYFFFDPRFGFEERLLAEDEEYVTVFTIDGETVKIPKDENNLIRKSDVLGLSVDYAIKNREDWKTHKHLYKAEEWRMHSNPPLSGSWFGITDMETLRAKHKRASENNKFKCLVFREPYECIREIMGTDTMLMTMAEDPGLTREMLEYNLGITLRMIGMFEENGLHMDGYWVWGDIAYNKGMFFSPQMYEEILKPFHMELFRHLGDYFIYHTDGNLDDCLPLLVQAGIKGINPIEIKAENDFRSIAERYGDIIVLTGGIDVRILASNDKKTIEREIKEKLQTVKTKKYIYHSDHSIPYDVSLDSYLFAMEMIRTYG